MTRATDKAFALIRSKIISGELAAGSQLKEEELAIMAGVSRTPVRDALRRLEAEYFVHRGDNQRTYVNSWTLEDIEDIFTLRAMLEGHAAAQAAVRASETDIRALRLIVSDLEASFAVAGGLDAEQYLSSNRDLHKAILSIAESERLAEMINRLVAQPVLMRTALSYDLPQMRQSHNEHTELVEAIAQGDSEWARSIMSAHIRRAFHVYKKAHLLREGPQPATPQAAE